MPGLRQAGKGGSRLGRRQKSHEQDTSGIDKPDQKDFPWKEIFMHHMPRQVSEGKEWMIGKLCGRCWLVGY